MRGKISLILVLILLFSSCSSNQTSIEEETTDAENISTDNESSADEECLTDEQIKSITKEIEQLTSELVDKESTITSSGDVNTYTQEDIDILYEELDALEEAVEQEYDQVYVDELKSKITFLKEQTGENYDNVDFENFGQDQIYVEILDGIIAPLEQKSNLSIEEQNELDQARLKIRLLEMTLDLYRSGSNYDESQQEAIEELKTEIAIAEGSIVGELESENQELQNEINDKYAYLSSVVPCDTVSSYEKAKEIGQNLSFEGCLSLSNFVEETEILNELNNWALNIENSIIIRSDEISEEEKVGYVESEINGDFIDLIEWGDGSINTIQKLREKIKKNIRFDRLNPSEQTLEKIRLYLSQVRSKANSQRAALLPLCELYEVTNNINLEDKKSSFTEEAVRDIDINRFCDIVDGNLDCPENKLFTPQNVSTCDASIVDPSMTRYELIDKFFTQSIYNPRWMRSSFGTRYVNGAGGSNSPDFYKAYLNPEIIFPDEAVQIIVKNNLGFNRGETKMLYNDNWVSAHNGGSEQPYLYDDGTHGDNIAGDGLYTNNCMALSRVPNFFNKPHQFNGDVHILDPKLKESVEIYHISENTWTTDKSMFMNIGYDYTQYENNNYPIVFSPNLDSQVYRKVFELFDDNINIITLGAREYYHGGHMMRLADHVRGTGFFHEYYLNTGNPAPAQDNKIKYGPWPDGKTHLELQAVLMLGDPKWRSFVHEFEHSILGQTGGGKYGFPRPGFIGEGSLSDDGMHLTGHSTANNSLQGTLRIFDSTSGEYLPVMFSYKGDLWPTRIEKDGDKFKAVRRVAKPDSEIFLYSAGVIGHEEVNETYYQLIDVTVEGCIKTIAEYVCSENNEVKAEEIISWNIDDYINHYGPRSYAYGEEPEKLNTAFIIVSERNPTEAELIFSHRSAIEAVDGDEEWKEKESDYSLNDQWKGLSNVNYNIKDLLIKSESYISLNKVNQSNVNYGDIRIQDIDIYKELIYIGLEKNSNDFIKQAINLIPSLPLGYMALAYQSTSDQEKYNNYVKAYDIAIEEIGEISNITEFGLISNLLEKKVLLNSKNNYDKNQLVKDQEMLAKYTNNAGWLAIEKAKEGIDAAASRICRADQEQYDIDIYDCADLVNIKQHPILLREVDQKNPIWFDQSLDDLLSGYRALGGGYKALGQLLAEKKDTERESLQLYLKAIETFRAGVSQDPKEETIDIKFLIREIAYTYSDLSQHPAVTEIESQVFSSMATYYFALEYPLQQKACEKYGNTYRGGGQVGDENGNVYFADYFCGRPPVYEPEGPGTYIFDYNNWEFVKV